MEDMPQIIFVFRTGQDFNPPPFDFEEDSTDELHSFMFDLTPEAFAWMLDVAEQYEGMLVVQSVMDDMVNVGMSMR